MTRITRLTIGALLTVAVLSPAATAQAEIPQPAPSVSAVAGESGSASGPGSILCTIIKLMLMNQGPQFCQ
ncbi:hypothetical protein [Nocardia implantans]|uniref:Uncharacterized protein n=1 Tax=Nocardia implantans TaxID=3108168 RepID=A0ABU6ANF2_9NOCA|nr:MULTISPECIES: hypothetical protein [unclassified Nocardia]MBF6192030.1 hypothetical protein [Nocardia beijingensis]MEA3530160.1 hypothetical protein [Nocardia sp. CDC192]MEB3508868.1 hypothetical protein [Nocardia sp. CDC186]